MSPGRFQIVVSLARYFCVRHTLRYSVAYRMLHDYEGYTLYNVRNRLRHQRLATTECVYDHFETI